MSLLPERVTIDEYWDAIYRRPLPFWEPALAHVAARHGVGQVPWTRATLGRNVVFLNSTTVIKFGPPFWTGNMPREAAALRFVEGRLPVATPPVVAEGTLEGWEYLIQERLPGTNLWELWGRLSSTERAGLAEQHGRLMAALHALPIDGVMTTLQFDWAGMLAEQRTACAAEMRTSGVDAALVEQVERYLADADPLLAHDTEHVLLQGDLTHLNFLVEQHAGRWQIVGLIDWGDVKIGPRSHEFISPGMHMYRGDRAALQQWYAGYGLSAEERTEARERLVMARAMLYYADGFAGYINRVPAAGSCGDWDCLARTFWRLRT